MVLETPDRSQTPPNKKKTPVKQYYLDKNMGREVSLAEAIKLMPKLDDALRMPSANTAEQMFLMAQKRGVI